MEVAFAPMNFPMQKELTATCQNHEFFAFAVFDELESSKTYATLAFVSIMDCSWQHTVQNHSFADIFKTLQIFFIPGYSIEHYR